MSSHHFFLFLFICVLLCYCYGIDLKESIFWNNLSDKDILKIINKIESKLRIYIYPIPSEVNHYINLTPNSYDNVTRHFKSEHLFIDHYESLLKRNASSLVVNDPSKANVFIIDHHWAVLTYHGKCDVIFSKHLKSIVDNVVDNHPYYNRSNGIDHYFFATYDRGPFCDPFCCPDCDPAVLKRILGAVFIGNYGMDKKHFQKVKYNNPVSNECHRAGHDIVIPQLIDLNATLKFHEIFFHNMFPYRQYDSTFAGTTARGDRFPLHEMCINSSLDYNLYHTENFKCFEYYQTKYLYYFGHYDLLHKGYFSYNGCGMACWSQRLYESMTFYTIPIIISDGAIQAFEKFIDWTKFTVKMSLTTWFNETLRNKFRGNVRFESEIYRNITIKCMKKIDSQSNDNWLLRIFKSNKHFEMTDYNFLTVDCIELENTFIYNKIKYYHQLVQWVDFNNLNKPINALKLLELEIYCRIRKFYKFHIHDFKNSSIYVNLENICSRSSDYTANLEYFY